MKMVVHCSIPGLVFLCDHSLKPWDLFSIVLTFTAGVRMRALSLPEHMHYCPESSAILLMVVNIMSMTIFAGPGDTLLLLCE